MQKELYIYTQIKRVKVSFDAMDDEPAAKRCRRAEVPFSLEELFDF